MTDYTVSIASRDQESQAIRNGIRQATSHDSGPFQYGHYIERYDGPLGDKNNNSLWTPLIYEADTLEEALAQHNKHRLDSELTSPYRHSRIVRRAVSPWEVIK